MHAPSPDGYSPESVAPMGLAFTHSYRTAFAVAIAARRAYRLPAESQVNLAVFQQLDRLPLRKGDKCSCEARENQRGYQFRAF
jgi:hypothetical protein